MTSAWRPSLESWGLPRYFFQTDSATEADVGPVAFGRVYGAEQVAVEQALHRVVAQDVHAALPVPGRPLSALLGKGVLAADTQKATPTKPVTLGVPVLTVASMASGAQEPALAERQCHTVRHLNLDNQPYTRATNREINAVSGEHDLTIVVGFLGSKVEADEVKAGARLAPLAEPSIGPVEENYTHDRGLIRPADITYVARANAYWDENAP